MIQCIMEVTHEPNVKILYHSLKNDSVNGYKNFAILKLVIDDENLMEQYKNRITDHNIGFKTNPYHDSGFDVLVPRAVLFEKYFQTKFIDMQIKTEMFYCEVETDTISTCAFNSHPRSSISKTPLMLANHTGIIDSGYRGSLIGAFRMLPQLNDSQYVVEKNSRLLQICHPSLCPIFVVCSCSNDLSDTTRGDGGFGSTN